MLRYLSNTSLNVEPGRYPSAMTKSMLSYWQIRCLQDYSINVVFLTSDILHANWHIWNQVHDDEYSMVLVLPEVLLVDGQFFWEVIVRYEKCAFCKSLQTVVIDKHYLE